MTHSSLCHFLLQEHAGQKEDAGSLLVKDLLITLTFYFVAFGCYRDGSAYDAGSGDSSVVRAPDS